MRAPGRTVVEGRDGPIEILRDGLGIPHCYATTEHDAFFAQGWVHAADRGWQMEYDRRRGTGRWSEVVGGRGVAADLFYRRMDLPHFVQRDLAALAPETNGMLDAYSDGVNAALAARPLGREFVVAGIEPAPWEPWHCLLVFRVRHLLMGSARSKLWRGVVSGVLGADVARTMAAGWGHEHVSCVPPGAVCGGPSTGLGDVDGGSNNWVLAGTRTASGLPLLAGDPHRELEAPNVYVQGHVACPDWDVLGITFAGTPGFAHFGHNQRVAWSITHGMADDQDLFVFPEGDAAAMATSSRTETISVLGGDDLDVEIVHTPRGPVVAPDLALCWTATMQDEANVGFDAIAPMLRASSVDGLFESMRPWVEPVNSLLAADTDGSIGYLTRGRVPRRPRRDAAYFPVPGDDESYAWAGWVPFEEMPRCVDPPEGFLFSANNHIAGYEGAPYIGLDCAAPGRAQRIVATLRELRDATTDDMTTLHRDVVSLPARRLVAGPLAAWPAITGWDGSMAPSSRPAAAYSVFRRELLLVVLERSGLGAALEQPWNRLLPGVVPETVLWRVVAQHLAADDTSLLGGGTWQDAVATATLRAAEVWGGETWGELHRTSQRHPLGDPSLHPSAIGVGGDLDTVFASAYTPTAGFAVKAASVARYAFDLADWDRSGWVIPLGADGEPGAQHAEDQTVAWSEGRLFPAPYTRAAVEAASGLGAGPDESPA